MSEPVEVLGEVLGLSATQIAAGGAYWTAREIAQQPQLWPELVRLIARDKSLADFLAPRLADKAPRIVLTGAGTSAFIGECLAPALAWEGRPESSPAPGVLRCAGWRPAHERHGVTNSQASFF